MELKNALELVSEIILKIETKEDLCDLIKDLFTPDEIIDVGARIQILRYLKKGLTQREISEKLRISLTTVSRGSRLYTYEKKIIHKLL
ncbi:winged helix-turn-helix transcriptional regulator [Candidatus Gracilibacteria bacterium]|nr:winged helix-turn-helix transcriptional regulator [Candidatus Gracilibacteria bacterium]NUJ98943.1 winged helix-turn-helix transcriptional regulator [Candidatus Gracilibacteria bacterium]